MATARKRSVAKRGKRRRRPSVILLVILGALLAGFVTRRLMLPSAMHYLTHRSAGNPPRGAQIDLPAPEGDHGVGDREEGDYGNSPAANAPVARPPEQSQPRAGASPANSEHLTARDRKQLDEILQHKPK